MPSSRLLAAVREFTTSILDPYDLADLLHRLTDHAVAVAGAQGAGILLAGREGLGFAAASNDGLVELEVTQDRIEDGPCHAAYEANQLVAVEDLRTEQRWPEYRERSIEHDYHAVLAVPMRAWGQTVGTLDIYRRDPGPWSETDRDAAEIMTSMGGPRIGVPMSTPDDATT